MEDSWKNITNVEDVETKYFICNECNQSYTNESDFLFHKNSHQTKFVCPYCLKIYTGKSQQKKYTHKEELTFTDSQQLIKHLEDNKSDCVARKQPNENYDDSKKSSSE